MGQISGQGNFTHIRQGSFFAVSIWQGVESKAQYTMHTCEIFVRTWVILRIYWRNPTFCGKVENPVQLNDGGQGQRRWSWHWIERGCKRISTVQLWDKNAYILYHTHGDHRSKCDWYGLDIVYKSSFKQYNSLSDFNKRRMKNFVIWHWLQSSSMIMLHNETSDKVIGDLRRHPEFADQFFIINATWAPEPFSLDSS